MQFGRLMPEAKVRDVISDSTNRGLPTQLQRVYVSERSRQAKSGKLPKYTEHTQVCVRHAVNGLRSFRKRRKQLGAGTDASKPIPTR